MRLQLRNIIALVTLTTASFAVAQNARPYQDLWIPPAITGNSFDLKLGQSSKSFWAGAVTKTYAFNDLKFWGPTLIMTQGQTVQLHVKNALDEPTTVHWHGLHLPAAMDGGPHQLIVPGGTWSPSFVVKNNAATYWYHPHPHGATQKQLTMGAGGLIIIRDPIESALKLPRTYGVDDIPLVLTSRRFLQDDQFSQEGDNDKYGDYPLTNGTLDPQTNLPAQLVRLRILNGEIERGYILGFSDNRPFHLISTDGGLVDRPIELKRLRLMVGERVEILVDLHSFRTGSTVDLMAYNSGQSFGFPGQEPGAGRPNGSRINNSDFSLLHIHIAGPTPHHFSAVPEQLTHNHFPNEAEATNSRTIQVTRGSNGGEFAFDNKSFDMHSTPQLVKLGAIEKWTIVNNPIFGHEFHIHDVQFKIVSRNGQPPEPYEQGWKDSVYLPRGGTVSFVARFEDYASDSDPFMYHCHFANHEDMGMMGEFLVVADPLRFRDKREHPVSEQMIADAGKQNGSPAPLFDRADSSGHRVSLTQISKSRPVVLFFIEKECPCSRDAAAYFERLQEAYSQQCTVIGIINAEAKAAEVWKKEVGVHFAVIPNPDASLMNKYQARQATYTTVIAPGGKIAKSYPGYGKDMLTELSRTVAEFTGIAVKSVGEESAPKTLTSGCAFE